MSNNTDPVTVNQELRNAAFKMNPAGIADALRNNADPNELGAPDQPHRVFSPAKKMAALHLLLSEEALEHFPGTYKEAMHARKQCLELLLSAKNLDVNLFDEEVFAIQNEPAAIVRETALYKFVVEIAHTDPGIFTRDVFDSLKLLVQQPGLNIELGQESYTQNDPTDKEQERAIDVVIRNRGTVPQMEETFRFYNQDARKQLREAVRGEVSSHPRIHPNWLTNATGKTDSASRRINIKLPYEGR